MLKRMKEILKKILSDSQIKCLKNGYGKYFASKYIFESRKKNSDHLVYILSGYKPQLWEGVFGRIKKYVPEEYDVCIISSGLYSEKLSIMAAEYGWSYLSTTKNNMAIIQNIVIREHECAKYIWKFDEDMYIGEGYFELLYNNYKKACEELKGEVGFVAPLIPINSYGYIEFLKEMDKLEEYEAKFGKAGYGCFYNGYAAALWTPEACKYLWSLTPDFDAAVEQFKEKPAKYSICPVRFSIGAIMFERKMWESMHYWRVRGNKNRNAAGDDEEHILRCCMVDSKLIVVCHNALVAHYGFGVIEKEMDEFFEKNTIKL